MILLTLTTSTDRGGLALFKDRKLLKEITWTRKSGQSEAVTPTLAALLKNFKLTAKDIGALVLDIGPGSFTGCRISTTLGKTLAQSLGISLHTTTSLDALIFQNQKKSADVLALIDAHKSLYYSMQHVQDSRQNVELLTQGEIEARVTPGSLVVGIFSQPLVDALKAKKVKFVQAKTFNFPQPQTLGRMFFEGASRIRKQEWKFVEPLYIRTPQVLEKNLKVFQ